MADILRMKADFAGKAAQMEDLTRKIPKLVAGAAEQMKDANFSAEGFVTGGAATKWKKRKKETSVTMGKRILSGTGYLQENVKAKALAQHVHVGVDLSKVPYAKIHNEGGKAAQHVKAYTRTDKRTGKVSKVRAHVRNIDMPERKFLGHSSDINKLAGMEIDAAVKQILK
ncbi:Mu-like prophage protein gpG [Bacteroidales bacterium Barb6XT]|nr:Mu-like prophage protein gpG [Bacteroidales bacterium Barb6XT]